ncbi:alpha-glucosidase [Haloarcula sp. JP-Z28]|uniref:Alpha-glucosidase n=1 Tax=Haloarcula marismortui (strain ATCC 43049 / DSM 3752 / JCM 8966 / VKM B-1809) TaxID=272569 RepID=Q5V5B9_HALMA|nr:MULTISPECIES: alpha-glucosidase [Haloarcula]AAV45283.1 alpha-glucosidase [Haloarcula marismortui ATCC 43049]NHN64988.1 alpha-glucosidase [Haloarcula sp. JP-Z28]QCP93063.1 alpha-glucosidase [Haloarcula marismortui ATCC 43049]
MTAARAWWKEAVVYQIYPRSFNDSDGDGVGDLQGIIERLDYVADLGVDVIWLNPVYDSPQKDNGYDISDYQTIYDEFGTMADWEALVEEVHNRDMRLVMDLVVNHTSDQHEWFRKSRQRDPEYEDYYIWREGGTDEDGDPVPPNNWESFFGGSAWEYDEERSEYFLHLYDTSQPDLNWRNDSVRTDIFDTIEWWLEKGIDGFRMDVINLLSKVEGLPDGDPDSEWVGAEHFIDGPEMLSYLTALDEEVLSNYDVMTVGEMPQLTVESALEYADTDGPLDMAFHFQHTKLDYADGERWSVGDWSLPELKRIIGRWQDGLAADGWNTLYWENHDQPRSVSRYGDPENYRRESAKLLGTFILTLRGTPYVYQGQELGMTNADWETMDDLRDVDAINHARELLDRDGVEEYDDVKDIVGYRTRDNARTPMQWDDSKNAGFTDGDPWIQVNPNYREINAADQQADVDSVYSYYQRLIQLRADRDVLVYGDYTDLLPDHETVFAFTRSLSADSGTERILVVLHFDDATETLDLPVEYADATLLEGNYDCDDTDPGTVTLAPYEARVYELFD